MNVLILETVDEQSTGLQYLDRIDPDFIYVFPGIPEGIEFHSMNVPEPFDIAFLTEWGFVLSVVRMRPTGDRVRAPKDTALAIEAKAGNLARWGFVPGAQRPPIWGGQV